MGKFNKNSGKNEEDQNNSVDWNRLLADFQGQSVNEAFANIMSKISLCQNVEFDQTCLVLKHYLILDENKSYLKHFIQHDQGVYLNVLIDRFSSSAQLPNVQWMISDLFKVLSSVCEKEEALGLLNSEKFRNLICQSLFDGSILEKIKSRPSLTPTEAAIVTNMFETVSNLCEIHNPLMNFFTTSHLKWMSEALVNSDAHRDLSISIARLFHLFSEYSTNDANNNNNASNLIQLLLDLFIKQNFVVNAVSQLSIVVAPSGEKTNDFSNNLTTKLYLIASLANLIISSPNIESSFGLSKKGTLTKLLSEYGNLIEYALRIQLNDNDEASKNSTRTDLNIQLEDDENETLKDESDDLKVLIKYVENLIECKQISLELIKSVCTFFIDDDENESIEEDEWEEVKSDDEETIGDDIEMNQDTKETLLKDPAQIFEFRQLIKNFKFTTLLINSIVRDDENIFQETSRIEHVFNGINLLRYESLQAYLIILQCMDKKECVELVHLLALLRFLAQKNNIEESLLAKVAEVSHEIFTVIFLTGLKQSNEMKVTIINFIKEILLKYKTNIGELCARMARILVLVAIKERNENLIEGQRIIEESARILIELTTASFELGDQTTIESLKLNAELLDLVIDLFGEDNLTNLENSLNFIERIKFFSEKFYPKYKSLAKNKKLKKDDGLIVRTVRDNLKAFVDYKSQNSK